MKSKRRIGLIGSIGALIIVSLFLFGHNLGVIANYNQGPFSGFTAGTYGVGNDDTADPTTRGMDIPAYHTQDASLENIFVQVYVVCTGDNALVRVAISTNGGASFSTFLWANNNQFVKQDYPDVQLYKDTADNNAIKVIVVWQEKPDDNSNEWQVKLRERCFNSNTWGSVQTVSNDMGQEQNIYPKVSTCSDNSISYWNVVWQRESPDYSNRFNVHLRRYVRGTGTEYWKSVEDIAITNSTNIDYKHPATDCIPEDYEKVYIIYDAYYSGSSPDNYIKLAIGTPSTDQWSDIQLSFADVDSSDGGDYSQNFPDIAAVEPADGEGIILDCVWIENDDNDEVYYKRSTDGGTNFDDEILISDDGYMSLRSVAVDSFVSVTSTFPLNSVERCHVIWTTYDDVYYRDRLGIDGDWDDDFEDEEPGAITDYYEQYVDVSTSAPISGTIIAYAVWDVDGSAVFFGWA